MFKIFKKTNQRANLVFVQRISINSHIYTVTIVKPAFFVLKQSSKIHTFLETLKLYRLLNLNSREYRWRRNEIVG